MATVRKHSHVRVTLRAFTVVAVAVSVAPAGISGQIRSTPEPALVVNAGPYGPYYHLPFRLTMSAIDFNASDRQTSSGGQFELRLHVQRFPIPAPNCARTIVVRMPWTAPIDSNAVEKIAAKRALLERIQALTRNPTSTVEVVLELNPYVKVIRQTPLRLELTGCNVFFRHAFGAYIPDTGPFRRR